MKPIKIRRKASKNPLKQPLLWAALALTPTAVYADCTQDSDCAEGQICETAPISNVDCFIDENGEEICTEEELTETVGYCTDAPINCVQDSDCPSHLRCEGFEGMTSSPGDPGALPPPPNPDEEGEPDPDADPIEGETEDVPAMCVYIPAECETDDDCGENFHCETYTYEEGCTMPVPVECEGGEDCPPAEDFDEIDCGEEEFSEGYCEPNEIECDSDDACPADWHCREMNELVCDDDDVTIAEGEPREDSGAFVDEPEPEDEDPAAPVACQELRREVCVPVGLDYVEISGGEVTEPDITTDPDTEINDGDGSGSAPGTDGDGDDDTDNDNTDNDNENDGDDDTDPPSENSGGDVEESSCSASSRGASPWTLFGLLALLGFRRRIAAS